MKTDNLLPWHHHAWNILSTAKKNNRLHHALLLMGGCDSEKKIFAKQFAAAVMCDKPTSEGMPCEICHSCRLIAAGSHPDLIVVEPDEVGHAIKIHHIRQLVDQVNETSQQGGFKCILIAPAHAMTIAASNALLKTLEEPPANTLLMLMTEQWLTLPATIRSRCQKVSFKKPTVKAALQWMSSQSEPGERDSHALRLSLADGWPLKALSTNTQDSMAMRQAIYDGLLALSHGKGDPLKFAAKCQEYDILSFLRLMLAWLRDMLRYRLTHSASRLINADYSAAFQALKMDSQALLSTIDLVQERYNNVSGAVNLNKQLLMEEIIINWVRYVSR